MRTAYQEETIALHFENVIFTKNQEALIVLHFVNVILKLISEFSHGGQSHIIFY